MSPPAAVVFVNSRWGWSWRKTNTTAVPMTTAFTAARIERGRSMAALMVACRALPVAATPPSVALLLAGRGRQLEDALELDALAVALPPADVAARARVHAHCLPLQRHVDDDQPRDAAPGAFH